MTTALNVQAGSKLTIGWREFISKTGSTQTSRWANDASSVQFFIDTSWADRNTARQEVLGYSKRQGGTAMHRVTPMVHPDYYWMYATDLQMQGINWTDKEFPNLSGPVSGYDLNRLAITYSVLPYDVLEDYSTKIVGAGGGEWNRYVIKIDKPTTEFASTDRNNMQFFTDTPVTTKAIAAPIGYRIAYVTLTWKWMYVPENYVADLSGRKINIENALGTVNNAAFPPACTDDSGNAVPAGYPAQTLYLDAVDYEPVNLPVDPVNILGYPPGRPPRCWNIIFSFKFINDVPFLDPAYTYNYRGHNLAPALSRANPNGGFYWYPVTPQVNPGQPLYTASDFTKIFQPV